MVDRRLFLILFAVTFLISVLHAERARNDNLGDFIDDDDDNEDVIETIKRFLGKKKTTTTTVKPGSGAISALITTTPTSSIFGGASGRKTVGTSTSKYGRTRATVGPTKDACGAINPCKNGGTCKTLSSGRFYCFCGQDYYGKNCENSKEKKSDFCFVF